MGALQPARHWERGSRLHREAGLHSGFPNSRSSPDVSGHARLAPLGTGIAVVFHFARGKVSDKLFFHLPS